MAKWQLIAVALGSAALVLLIVLLAGMVIALAKARQANVAAYAAQPPPPPPDMQPTVLPRFVPQLGEPLLSAPSVYTGDGREGQTNTSTGSSYGYY